MSTSPEDYAARKAEKAALQQKKISNYNQLVNDLELLGHGFREWPKISRLNRDIVITEKIDGTNAAVGVIEIVPSYAYDGIPTTKQYKVYAQSRNKIITPDFDNSGFAAWVERNASVLATTLGPGLHFGEWWGVGIQRGYGMSERRFSLFNTAKWHTPINGGPPSEGALALANARLNGVAIYSVPVLWEGPWCVQGVAGFVVPENPVREDGSPNWSDEPGNPRPRYMPNFQVEHLRRVGSIAAPGFMNPEGIVTYHKASGVCFKSTLEGDEAHKTQPRAGLSGQADGPPHVLPQNS